MSPPRRPSVPPPFQSRERQFVPQSQREPDGGDASSDTGPVQTMCVRTCDGYYWPLHFPVARSELKAEAALCHATCNSETKLYMRADPGVDPEEMMDEGGVSYGASRTAFLYRKQLINGCTCRPMPWSDSERARHEGYALAEQEKKLRAELAEVERLAAASRPKEADDGLPVAGAAIPPATVPSDDGPQMGPQELALLQARRSRPAETEGEGTTFGRADPPSVAKAGSAERRRLAVVRDGAVHARAERAPRRIRVAQQGGFGWFGGAGHFTYPGDPPGR